MTENRPLEPATTTAGGARRAATRRRTADGSALAAAGLLVAAVVAVAATGQPSPTPAPGPEGGELVDRAVRVCLEAPAGRARGEVVAGLAPAAGLDDGGGWRTGDVLPDTDGRPPARGSLVRLAADGETVEATGPAAPGLFATRIDTDGPGLAVGGCVEPRARWWFAGAGAGLDHGSVLTLANADDGPVVLDVRVLAESGEVETVGTRGITLGPGETRDIDLTDIAPQNDEVVVAVEASRGRVAAAVTDRFASVPGAAGGTEWLPAAEEPSRTVRLAGLPSRARARTLVVGNPSEVGALVDLEVVGPGGTFTPVGASTVTVPPGGVVTLDVDDLVAEPANSALRLRAQVPVVAALRSQSRADHAYAGTVVPLDGPAVAPVVDRAGSLLQLSAGAGGAAARVSLYDEDGKVVEESTQQVEPRATTSLRLPRRAAYVLVVPRSGNLTGAVAYDGAAGTAVSVLEASPLRVSLPVVVPGPR